MKTTFFTKQKLVRMARIILLLAILASARAVFSQSVTILPSGITPNQSGSKPRLTYDAIMALPDPQNGDEAYDITFNCVRLYKKNKWVKILTEADLANPSLLAWQIGGPKFDSGTSIATDADGNVYAAGFFSGTAQFEDTEVTADMLAGYNLYLAKYTNTGHLLWVQKAGFAANINNFHIVLDASGNIYAAGDFNGSFLFGANTFSSAGYEDIFVAKYNNNGVLQWAQQAGGSSSDLAKGIGIDGNGNVYVSGIVNGTAIFGGFSYIGNSDNDIFIAKYRNDGSFNWVRRAASDNVDMVNSMVVDANGLVTITGHFENTIGFGNTTLTSAGSKDVFLAQYNDAGNFVWAKRMGGTNMDVGVDIALDGNNNCIVSGLFYGIAIFEGLSKESAGGSDVFIVKINSAGNLIWAISDGGTTNEKYTSIALDANDNIYMSGGYYTSTQLGGITLYGRGNTEIFVAKYNAKGDFQWVREMGGNGQEGVSSLVVDAKGNAYITGNFTNEFSADDTMLISRGLSEVFVMRIRD